MTTDTRSLLIDATFRLVQQKGFHGTSLGDILSASGAPRGSLYYHFPGGKEELVLEAMLRAARHISAVLRAALAPGCDPAEGVRRYVEAAAEELRDSDFLFGCPVAPVVLDNAGDSPALEAACREVLEEWYAILTDGLVAAGSERLQAETLATLIVSSIEGGLIFARARRDTAPLDILAAELARMVRSALPHPHHEALEAATGPR